MANIIWPSSLCPRTFSLKLNADVRASTSPFGGNDIVTDLADDYWTVDMTVDSRQGVSAALVETLVNRLQGGLHTAEFGHFARPQPAGTVLSTVLASSAAKMSNTVTVTASLGQTVKAGDLFKISNLLLMCAEDVTASSSTLTIPLVNRLRNTLAAGSTVSFDNPKLKFRLVGASSVSTFSNSSGSVSLSFEEDI